MALAIRNLARRQDDYILTANVTAPSSPRHFEEAFEAEYGMMHPRFFPGAYARAVQRAGQEGKLLLIYLHSPRHESTPVFCREVLTSDPVVSFLDDNFILWGGDIRDSEAYVVSSALRASTYPFMAVLATDLPSSSSTSTSHSPRHGAVLQRLEGIIDSSTLVAVLVSTLERHLALMEHAHVARTQQDESRRLRDQQDQEYLLSLEADRQKQIRIQEDEKKRREEEEERRQQQERERLREEELRALRENMLKCLTEEPSGEIESERVTHLVIRLSDGTKVGRRFDLRDRVEAVYAFVVSQQPPADFSPNFVLVSQFPRRSYSNHSETLLDAQLYPQAVLFVQEVLGNTGTSSC